jgi:glycosyltransferase involved in cell wall biosynthesis
MRLLLCTDTYPPQVNGVSVVSHLRVEQLLRRGWECAVIGPTYPASAAPPLFPDLGVPHLTLPSVPLPRYPEIRIAFPKARAVARFIDQWRPDLIHCETEFVIGRLGQRAALDRGIPVVSSYHTDFGRYMSAWGMPWLAGPMTSYLTRFHRRMARTYTPSAVTRKELTQLGIPHVEVWGRGVDTVRFRPRPPNPALRNELGVGSCFTFLHVGRLAPEKGADRILRAFDQAQRILAPVPVRLLVVGEGPARTALERAAPPGVGFLGYLDRERTLPELYAVADAFVFASVTETLGLVILEAMASGLPIVAAPAGGVADHFRHGVNGLSYPPNDEERMAAMMVELVREPALRESLADGARRTAEALSWEAEFDRLEQSYREVYSAARRGPALAAPALGGIPSATGPHRTLEVLRPSRSPGGKE